jgi:uncharacterized protein
MKYLLVLIVVLIGVLLLKKQWKTKHASLQTQRKPGSIADDLVMLHETEPMMRCAHCGVFHPKSSSIVKNDRYYCSHEHAEQHQR